MNLIGKIVVEIEEFVALRNAKPTNEAKSFLSKLSDRIKITYEKFSTDDPRTKGTNFFKWTIAEERRYLTVWCHKENRKKAIYIDKDYQGKQSEKDYLDSIRDDFKQALAYGYKLHKEKKHSWSIPKELLEDLYQEQEKFKYLNPDVEDIRYFLEEYKVKTQEPNITCFKELSMQGYGIKSKSFSEIMDNYFPERKAVRSSKIKRISPSGISIPVKLYYKRPEKIDENFMEVDDAALPKERQEPEQIKIYIRGNQKL